MEKKDPRIDAFIAKSQDFAKPILEHFRMLVHKACPDVTETIKWGMPAYDYKGLIAISTAFKQHCAIIFWRAPLMKDKKLIENAKSEEAMGHLRKLYTLKDLPKDKVLIGYLKESVKINEAGIKNPPRKKTTKKDFSVPDYFLKAIKKNKMAFETFKNFTPAKQKEYVVWITEAKTEETRNKRMATSVEWLAEGKQRNWKYLKC